MPGAHLACPWVLCRGWLSDRFLRHATSVEGAVAEAIVRINWGLALGGFDFDFSDEEIRYRFAMDVEGGALTEPMMENLIGCAVQTVERYRDALLRVAFEDGDPQIETAGLELTE